MGKAYTVVSGSTFAKDTKDASGKTWVLSDVATNLEDGSSVALGDISPETSYQVVVATGGATAVEIGGSGVTNTATLRSTTSGIDVSAPAVKSVELVSTEKIVVTFDETIKSNLKPADISVAGFVLAFDGGAPTPAQLTGSNQIKYTVNGDKVTIEPANSLVKFATGVTVDGTVTSELVKFAANTIKDANGIENAEITIDPQNDTKHAALVIDNAKPVILSGKTTAASHTLALTFSEDVASKTSTTVDIAKQFDVKGVEIAGTATEANLANNLLTLTFAQNTFDVKDYSSATVTYIQNVNALLTDISANKNAVSNTTFKGFKAQ